MAEYKILAVSQKVRDYDSKFGPMKSYKLKLSDTEMAVDLSQKASSTPPAVGDVLNGTIDMSGQYGPKFKKDFAGGRGKHADDPFTMFLSYAKDLVVALVETKGFDQKSYEELLTATLKGGKALYAGRPNATQEPATSSDTTVTEKDLSDSWGDSTTPDQIPIDDNF